MKYTCFASSRTKKAEYYRFLDASSKEDGHSGSGLKLDFFVLALVTRRLLEIIVPPGI